MEEPAARPAREVARWSVRQRLAALAAGLVLVGAGGLTVDQFREYRADQRLADDRGDVLRTAKEIAAALATISPDSARQDIEALAERGTPEFAEQVRSNLDAQVDLISSNEVSSTGKVQSAGIVDLEDEQATVAVALVSQVRNSATKKAGEERSYRMTVSLERIDNGPWLASQVVFVQ